MTRSKELRWVCTLYHANAMILVMATPPTTAPATIPPTGTEDASTVLVALGITDYDQPTGDYE